ALASNGYVTGPLFPVMNGPGSPDQLGPTVRAVSGDTAAGGGDRWPHHGDHSNPSRDVTATRRFSRRARLAMAISQFVNKRGIYLGRRSTKIHVALYRWSGGRIGAHFPGSPGAPILLLDHVGAKSGIRRTSPLMYYREGSVITV